MLSLLILAVPQVIAASTTAELFESPHTLEGTLDQASFIIPGQGREVWTIRTTSDGRHGWAAVSVATRPGVYYAPDSGAGHQSLDYDAHGRLILWRLVSEAVEYDFVARTARSCVTHAVFMISPDGSSERQEPPSREHLIGPFESDMLRNWFWGGLGDASMPTADDRTAQQGTVAGALAASGEFFGSDPEQMKRATATSFSPTFDPAVKKSALALLRECKGDPEPEDN